MKRYEKYKNSGVEWLGEVPEQWSPIYLKYLFSTIVGGTWGNDPTENSDVYCIRVADFKYEKYKLSDTNLTLRQFRRSELNNRLLSKGDLILEKSGGGEKTPVGRVVLFDLDISAVCSNFTNRLVPKRSINSNYLKYFFAFIYAKNVTISHIKQTTGIQNLSIESFLNEKIYYPVSFTEQLTLSLFLDYKIGNIDQLIYEKETIISKLQEKRKALISEVVNKGLDPNAPMRNSGIEWLGMVPEHWKVTKINRAFNEIGSGTTPTSGTSKYYENGDVNWLNTGDLNDGVITKTNKRITSAATKEHSTLKLYPKGSVVIALYGATIGKLGLLEIDTTTNQACCVLSDSKSITQKYLFYFLYSSREHIISLAYGGGQPNISQELIKQLPILQTSIEEQSEIVEFIESRNTKIEQTISEIQIQIQKLKEYKTAVISEVVTGKVDVRDWEEKNN